MRVDKHVLGFLFGKLERSVLQTVARVGLFIKPAPIINALTCLLDEDSFFLRVSRSNLGSGMINKIASIRDYLLGRKIGHFERPWRFDIAGAAMYHIIKRGQKVLGDE